MRSRYSPPRAGHGSPALSGGIDVASIIERMKRAYEVSSDAELAEHMEIAKTTISSWRRRNSIPLDACLKAALETFLSLDELITGRPREDMLPGIHDVGIDVRLMEMSMYAVDQQGIGSTGIGSQFEDDFDRSSFRARILIRNYARAAALKKEAIEKPGFTEEQFYDSLRRTFDAFRPFNPDGEDSAKR